MTSSSQFVSTRTAKQSTNDITEFNNNLHVNADLLTYDIVNNNSISTNSLSANSISLSNTTSTFNCNGNAIFNRGVRLNAGLAGYHIDGVANYITTPIFCSLKSFGRGDTDDYWFLNPGFKIDLYDANNYTGFLQTFDNTNGTTGVLYSSSFPNRTASFIIYFNNSQISFSPLSF